MGPIVAVDPGKSGGLAFQYTDGSVGALPMPETEGDLVDQLAVFFDGQPGATLYLERVGGYVGGSGQPGSAMFTFGWWASGPLWIALCYQVRVVFLPPQKWQKLLGLGNSKDDKAGWKRKLKERAQELFPEIKVTLKTADALLILEAARKL